MTCVHKEIQAFIITGATGSGKSAVAVELAQKLGGEVISADSMQIYKYFDIGTAKITEEEKHGIKHHLIDEVLPTEEYSVAKYIMQAEKAILEIAKKGKVPIICGGTPQYIYAFLTGMTFSHINVTAEVKLQVDNSFEKHGPQAMWQEMAKLDPTTAQNLPWQNIRRLKRFFEVYLTTGMTRSEVNAKSLERGPFCQFVPLALDLEPALLEAKIKRRVEVMFNMGFLEEIEFLVSHYPDLGSLPAMAAIGYKEAYEAYLGVITKTEAKERIALVTRQYAKRQKTWMCNKMLLLHHKTADSLLQCSLCYKK